MIAIEPVPSISSLVRRAIRRRELSQFLACAAEAAQLAGEVSVLLTGDAQIRALNRQFRGKDKATDVLSFPAASPFSGGHAGDLAISIETASRQAAELGHTLQIEVKVLLLHGLLHLAGFDHETDSGEMARREARLRKQLALPAGLIEREHARAASSGAANTSARRPSKAAASTRSKRNRAENSPAKRRKAVKRRPGSSRR